MRNFITMILCSFCMFSSVEGQSPYNATVASYNGNESHKSSSFAKQFRYLPMANWTSGMRFMVVPDRMKLDVSNKLEIVPYRSRKSAIYVGLDQREFEWKEFSFLKIEERRTKCGRSFCNYAFIIFESNGRKYEYPYPGTIEELKRERGLSFVNSLIYLNDIDKAKQKLVGKKLYMLRHDRSIENPDGRKLNTSDKKFVEVTITKIGVGSRANPVRVIYKQSNGKEFYTDITLSGINTSKNHRATVWFDEVFSLDDPKRGYPTISGDTWTMIQDGEVKIGMTKEECVLAWGEPNKINDDIRPGDNMEQWVYKRNFLYFENGLLSSIQGYE